MWPQSAWNWQHHMSNNVSVAINTNFLSHLIFDEIYCFAAAIKQMFVKMSIFAKIFTKIRCHASTIIVLKNIFFMNICIKLLHWWFKLNFLKFLIFPIKLHENWKNFKFSSSNLDFSHNPGANAHSHQITNFQPFGWKNLKSESFSMNVGNQRQKFAKSYMAIQMPHFDPFSSWKQKFIKNQKFILFYIIYVKIAINHFNVMILITNKNACQFLDSMCST